MDLYNPLYVGRPTVEPELFASLRPPTYSGVMQRFGDRFAKSGEAIAIPEGYKQVTIKTNLVDGVGGFVPQGARVDVMYIERLPNGRKRAAIILQDILVLTVSTTDRLVEGHSAPPTAGSVTLAVTDRQGTMIALAEQRGQLKLVLRDATRADAAKAAGVDGIEWMDDPFDQSGRAKPDDHAPPPASRQFAAEVAKNLKKDLDLGRSVQSVATASALGDYYQYVIDRPVDLARQKSALLPIVNKDVEGKRVSIYNPGVQPKHPLLGLRFKNTTGMPLSQGPITVFDGSVDAGDTRVLDLQPDEERLVSYAIDLGTEVATKPGNNTSRITSVKAIKGIVYTNRLVREERVYDVSNRSTTDRTLLIEHPNRKGDGFKFVGEHKPKEEAADVFRFEVPVAAKKDLSYTVIEERDVGSSVLLTNNRVDEIQYFLSLKEAPQALKDKLTEALKVKESWDKVRGDIQATDTRVQTIATDQRRLRENMRELPKDSDLFKKYLKTLEEQETEMTQLQAKLKALHADEVKTRRAYDDFLANLSAE